MKRLILLIFLLNCHLSFSQVAEDDEAAQQLIENFFDAFHKQDSIALKSFAHPEIKMHSVAIDAAGDTSLSIEEYSEFIKYLVSIPASTDFEEKLHEFEININGMIATVSTTCSFYVNNELSHCGVNTFQLMKSNGNWKIIYLVDTRSKLGCE